MAAPPDPLDQFIEIVGIERARVFFGMNAVDVAALRERIAQHFAPAPGKQVYYPADLLPVLVGDQYSRWMREFRTCCQLVQFASSTIVRVHLGQREGEPFDPRLWVDIVGMERLRHYGFTEADLHQQVHEGDIDGVKEFILEFDTNADGTYKAQAIAFGDPSIPRGVPFILAAGVVDVMIRMYRDDGFLVTNEYGNF